MYENVKLGKLAPKNDPRTLKVANYFTAALPTRPQSSDYLTGIDRWSMFANDRVGDCTFATAGHLIKIWNHFGQHDGDEVTEKDVLDGYADCTGYDPSQTDIAGNNPTDRGAVEHDVLQYWFHKGIGGHGIGAWADVDPKNIEEVKTSMWLFGGLYLGIALPKSAQNQDVWDVVSCFNKDGLRYSWGGHAAPGAYYDDEFVIVVTWAGLKKMTWKFWLKYIDEAHAIISKDWFDLTTGLCPAGFDIEALAYDLKLVTA